jgi:hypothetical protein
MCDRLKELHPHLPKRAGRRSYAFREVALSAMQIALAIGERAWPGALLLSVWLLLKIPVVGTAAWILFLRLIGVSKAERRRLAIAAAKRHLNLRDLPAGQQEGEAPSQRV